MCGSGERSGGEWGCAALLVSVENGVVGQKGGEGDERAWRAASVAEVESGCRPWRVEG